ncbi:MAG TPA: tetratricopeptide repeat protein [Vicinamibacterales bacterium]|nr:tetratricopeptide repeat protein [Vicinamibacterales bacterium]
MTDQYIGPYRVIQKLAAGGMGEVFLCDDERLGRRVAVKRTSGGWTDSPEGRERLRREARAAAALNHPRIAAVHDVLETSEGPQVVMEYVEGETLSSVLRRGRVPLERALQIGIELAEAVGAAHANGIVHRDLKPANVMITMDGHVKVLDFGLAKHRPPIVERAPKATPLTAPGEWLGTPGYTAPEQFLGSAADHRSDLFSFGAILYELFTGRRAIEATDALSLAAAISRPIPPASQIDRALPQPIAEVIDRLLKLQPSDRPRSADEVRTILSAAFSATSRTRTARADRRASAHRIATWVWAVVALVLVLAGTAAYMKWRSSAGVTAATGRPVVLAVVPLDNLTGDASNDFLGSGFAASLITDLSPLPGLTVLSRAAVREAGASGEPARIARQLGATLVLGGDVHRSADQLRVNLVLTAADGSIVWSDAFSGRYSALLDLQPQLAEAVSAGLPLRLSADARERLAQAPTNNVEALAAYWRGRQLMEKPDDQAAVRGAFEAFRHAVSLDQRFAAAQAGLAEAAWQRYVQTRDAQWADRALEATDRALALDPRQPSVWISRATVHRGTGRTVEALVDLDRALELQPNSDEALRLKGRLLVDQGKVQEAVSVLEQAIARRPQYWGGYDALGAALYFAGRRREAIKAWERAAELRPDVSRSYHNLGIAYREEGNLDKALEYYRKAVEITPMPQAYSAIGEVHYLRGEYEAALASFAEAARLAPNESTLRRNLGDTYRRLKNDARAREAYEEAVRLARADLQVNPNSAVTKSRLAVYLAKLGRAGEAQNHAAEALASADRSRDVHYRVAVVYALTGHRDAAFDQLERAIALGYSPLRVREDEDLAILQDDPRFTLLLARPRAGENRRPQ